GNKVLVVDGRQWKEGRLQPGSQTRRAPSTESATLNFSIAYKPMLFSVCRGQGRGQLSQRRDLRPVRRDFRPHRSRSRNPVQPQAEGVLSRGGRHCAEKHPRAWKIGKG